MHPVSSDAFITHDEELLSHIVIGMRFIVKILINTLAIMLAAEILPGIHVENFLRASLVALLLAVLNVTLKPVLILLTIPITIITLGLFLLVINALMILLASNLINGFHADGFWWALLFSIVMTIINSVLENLVAPKAKRQ